MMVEAETHCATSLHKARHQHLTTTNVRVPVWGGGKTDGLNLERAGSKRINI